MQQRLYPGEPVPANATAVDDDWFRFHARPGANLQALTDDDVIGYEVHEMGCTMTSCAYRPSEPCAHPNGCGCSNGECQR